MTKNAILYSKYSTPLSSKGTVNIYLQQAKLEEYCIENNINVVAEFSDTDVVGSTLERKSFQKLIEYVEVNKDTINYLLVTNWNVVTRYRNDFKLINELLNHLNIEIVAIEEVNQV